MSGPRLDGWPPLPLASYARRPVSRLAFPLEEPGCRVFHRARHGLWHAVRALGLGAGDRVLVPAYHHGSEVEALVQARVECVFYEATDDLAPDERELESLLAPDVRALHLVHYLGFPQDGERWRRWCDERGLLLIEDAAQAWLAHHGGRPVGAAGDVAIFSLYKTFGFPDGGAVISRSPLPRPVVGRNTQRDRLLNRHKAWLSQRWPAARAVAGRGGGGGDEGAAQGPADPISANRFELGNAGLPASGATRFLLRRVFDPSAAERRRANYEHLLERLGELVPPPFGVLPEGASPFLFPVRSAAKEALLRRLRDHDVLAVNLWSVPHPALPVEHFPAAAARRASDVGLPVHQELLHEHLEQIVRGVRD